MFRSYFPELPDERGRRIRQSAVAMNSSPPEPRKKAETPRKKVETALRSHLPPYLPNREFDVYVVDDGTELADWVKGGLARA